MSTATYDSRHDREASGAAVDEARLPPRPRRRYLTGWSLLLIAAVACAAGFYAGVRIEKGQVSAPSAGTGSGSGPAALATRLRSSAAGRAPGLAGAGGGGAAGGGSFGIISSVRGNVFYLTTSTGNTVKVNLSSATKISKSLGVSRASLHPGDTVIIRGITNSSGALVAASVSDSGASASGAGGSSSSSSSSSSGSGSLRSLFSAGG